MDSNLRKSRFTRGDTAKCSKNLCDEGEHRELGESTGEHVLQPGRHHPVWTLVLSLKEASVMVPISKVLLLISYQITENFILFISDFIFLILS